MSKYDAAHREERERWRPVVEAGAAVCSEPVCVVLLRGGSRRIHPLARWHLSHDPTGTRWIGPSHACCNQAESARRNNPKRGQKGRPAAPAWVL